MPKNGNGLEQMIGDMELRAGDILKELTAYDALNTEYKRLMRAVRVLKGEDITQRGRPKKKEVVVVEPGIAKIVSTNGHGKSRYADAVVLALAKLEKAKMSEIVTECNGVGTRENIKGAIGNFTHRGFLKRNLTTHQYALTGTGKERAAKLLGGT